MAMSKLTVTMDAATKRLAEESARRAGLSLSAWLARAARREAVRLGVGPAAAAPETDVLAEALADESDYALAEEHQRRAG
ncbi:hypothetical protein ACQEVB_08400 [Pseudonocardia sp. CA-107938]|uniref:hypothetical protein n=1 Tax=Pseudonocardia sp. CA-107938 TaxID=3240021 RepID=UPI003D8DFFE0